MNPRRPIELLPKQAIVYLSITAVDYPTFLYSNAACPHFLSCMSKHLGMLILEVLPLLNIWLLRSLLSWKLQLAEIIRT